MINWIGTHTFFFLPTDRLKFDTLFITQLFNFERININPLKYFILTINFEKFNAFIINQGCIPYFQV